MRSTNPNGTTGAARPFALATLAVSGATALGMFMIHGGTMTPFWPANGVLLAFLLTAPRKRWPGYLTCGFLVSVVIHMVYHYSLSASVQMGIANSIEIYVAAWPFRASQSPPNLSKPGTLLRFALFAGVLAPVCSGIWVLAFTSSFLHGFSMTMKFRLWYFADSLGMMMCVPVTLALLAPDKSAFFTGRRIFETFALLSLSTTVALLVFRDERYPFPFVVLVILIPVIFQLGLVPSAIAVLLISVPASHYTFAGHGPLVHASPLYWTLYLQSYSIILLAVVYVLSAARSEEKRLADELRSSEARYRALAETSQDLILRTTLDGARTYVSPSVRAVTGWAEEELPPPGNFHILIHPADRAHFAGFLEKLRVQPGSHTLVYRAKRRDGRYGWLEAYVGTVFTDTAVPNELVWTIRDVSWRVEQEETLKSERQKAQELAWTDALTGLSNRRAFDDRLAAEWSFACQHKVPLSLLLLDVDHFKSYNDTYGHQAGDEALRRIAQVIGECTRQSGDLAARYGGEEFVVLLPHADVARAHEVAERIRERVLELRLEHRHSACGFVTMSIGVSSASRAAEVDAETLIASADGALYASKRGGRNRISIAPEDFRSADRPEPMPEPHLTGPESLRPA
jgi:diguanylate cyclase (GGDEF)-like protein/PAS domain S-box-containing protein